MEKDKEHPFEFWENLQMKETKRLEQIIQRDSLKQNAINTILYLALKDMPLDELLKKALDVVVHSTGLGTDAGGIYLVEFTPQELQRKAHVNLSERKLALCEKIPFGHCICGQAISERKLKIADCRGKDGETEHIHCCVPVLHGDSVLGAISLCCKSEEVCKRESEFLMAIANILAGLIMRRKVEDDLRTVNQSLEEMMQKLKRAQTQTIRQERLRALGEMASGIAHDFNNALMPITGFSELLLMRTEYIANREIVVNHLEKIHKAANDAEKIVGRLREFYRKREGRDVFRPVNLDKLIEQTVSITSPRWKDQAQAKGKTIEIKTVPGKIPPFPGKATELREALTNLIFNAVDAIEKNGVITISTRVDGKYAILEISDTGAGMSDHVCKKCLEPYYTTKGFDGTGMGLSMVYGIVTRHKGEIEIISKPGKGTTFVLKFFTDLKMDDFQDLHKKPKKLKKIRKIHVLLVDDENKILEVTGEYLKEQGHSLETANDGQEGLEKFRAGKFDLIITDRAMPEMNGDHLAAAVKRESPKMPVILLTGFGDMMKSAGEIPDGVDLVVSKPLTLEKLLDALASVKYAWEWS